MSASPGELDGIWACREQEEQPRRVSSEQAENSGLRQMRSDKICCRTLTSYHLPKGLLGDAHHHCRGSRRQHVCASNAFQLIH